MSSEKWPIAVQVIQTGLFVLAGCWALESSHTSSWGVKFFWNLNIGPVWKSAPVPVSAPVWLPCSNAALSAWWAPGGWQLLCFAWFQKRGIFVMGSCPVKQQSLLQVWAEQVSRFDPWIAGVTQCGRWGLAVTTAGCDPALAVSWERLRLNEVFWSP